MSRRGRAAALPQGAPTSHGLLAGGTIVRRYVDADRKARDFDFGRLPVSQELQGVLAQAFADRTAPGRGLRSMDSLQAYYRAIRLFAEYLATLDARPAVLADVVPERIDGFLAHRRGLSSFKAAEEMRSIKTVLLHIESLDSALVAKLREPNPPIVRKGTGDRSYSRAELRRIADAARSDLRAAAMRIRTNRMLLARYRDGQVEDPTRRLELLDFVDRHGDVPRTSRRSGRARTPVVAPWVTEGGFGKPWDIVEWAHLSGVEVTAGAVLLAVMTGQNPLVILRCPAAHHRADGHAGSVATAIVDTHKPRRGHRAYMNLALTEIPDWISIPGNPQNVSARDELHTPFGLYRLLLELTDRSRAVINSDQLLIGYRRSGGSRDRTGRGLRPQARYGFLPHWSQLHSVPADTVGEGPPATLTVTLKRIRLTYLELHQKPVAHTEQTLATDYLARNRGNLIEYRKVVADALTEQVATARVAGVMTQLNAAEVTRARGDVVAAADQYGLDPVTVKRMLDGELDTVMNACVDNTNSPHAPAGQPCRASFMQCLGCPCARALPRHLPIQVHVHDQLLDRKAAMTPMEWTRRFAVPHTQLADLLGSHDDEDLAAARASITDTDRETVKRFLNRGLDIR